MLLQRSSFIYDLLSGEQVTQVRAPGNPPSDTVAPFTVLNLDLQPERPNNVEDISGCISRYTAETTIEGMSDSFFQVCLPFSV